MTPLARHAGALAALTVLLLRAAWSPAAVAVAGTVGLAVAAAVALAGPAVRALASPPPSPPDD